MVDVFWAGDGAVGQWWCSGVVVVGLEGIAGITNDAVLAKNH